MAEIRKAVFPVAGLGTRFLPATKASAKEMMPVVDKPLIQYAVEEAIAAGCDQLIFISGRGKRAIEDHFDVSYELENELEKRGKKALLEQVQSILPSHVSTIFLRQPYPLGLGHAVLMAKPVVGDEPFAVLLADDLMLGEPPVLAQMVEQHHRYQAGILGVEEIPREHSTRYGVVDARPWDERVFPVGGIVEAGRAALRGDRPCQRRNGHAGCLDTIAAPVQPAIADCIAAPDPLVRRSPASRPDGGVVTQRTANPCTPVRFRLGPPHIALSFENLLKFGFVGLRELFAISSKGERLRRSALPD